MKISARAILAASLGLGSQVWGSAPGGKSRFTSTFSPPTARASACRGKRLAMALSFGGDWPKEAVEGRKRTSPAIRQKKSAFFGNSPKLACLIVRNSFFFRLPQGWEFPILGEGVRNS